MKKDRKAALERAGVTEPQLEALRSLKNLDGRIPQGVKFAVVQTLHKKGLAGFIESVECSECGAVKEFARYPLTEAGEKVLEQFPEKVSP